MKKFIQLSLTAVAFVIMTSFAHAADVAGNINVLSNGIVKVEATGAGTLNHISILDETGNTLYELNDMKAGDFKNIDFSMVPDGNYFIKIENARSIQTTQVSKLDGAVSSETASSMIVKPVFRRNENILNVFFTNPSQNNVEISVYDQNGLLVNHLKTQEASVAKAFDFSKSLHGNYKVVLSQDNYTFSTDFDF